MAKKPPEQPKKNVTPRESAATIAPAEQEVLSQDIDSRMKALYEDHKRMGVRK